MLALYGLKLQNRRADCSDTALNQFASLARKCSTGTVVMCARSGLFALHRSLSDDRRRARALRFSRGARNPGAKGFPPEKMAPEIGPEAPASRGALFATDLASRGMDFVHCSGYQEKLLATFRGGAKLRGCARSDPGGSAHQSQLGNSEGLWSRFLVAAHVPHGPTTAGGPSQRPRAVCPPSRPNRREKRRQAKPRGFLVFSFVDLLRDPTMKDGLHRRGDLCFCSTPWS